jgi:hypothetical protein
MGKLRIEPKVKPPVTKEEYEYYKKLLSEARSASDSNNVFYDLDDGENPRKVRRALQYVAEAEGLGLSVRANRKDNNLALRFSDGSRGSASRGSVGGRISAAESKERILDTLRSSKNPLKKAEIVSASGVSPSSWNLRIKELLEEKLVQRHGSGRETTYTLKRK